jgi:hypothetical protein
MLNAAAGLSHHARFRASHRDFICEGWLAEHLLPQVSAFFAFSSAQSGFVAWGMHLQSRRGAQRHGLC